MGTMTTRVKDFTWMNFIEFHGAKVGKDPQEFIEVIQKIVDIIGVTLVECENLIVYQL